MSARTALPHPSARPIVAARGMAEPVSAGAALITGKKVAPDATRFLMVDHLEAFGLFDTYAAAEDPELRERSLLRLIAALKAHMRVEEELVYPVARDATGDTELVAHAEAEHAEARALIARLEQHTDADDAQAVLVAELRDAIRRHVEEEHAIFFPRLRETAVDLYALGRGVAARRKEELLALTGRDLEDQHMSPAPHDIGRSSSGAADTGTHPLDPQVAAEDLVAGLRNAHAVALAGRSNTQRQIERLENYPRLKARLEQHASEKVAQIRRLEAILEARGEGVSTVKDAVQTVTGNAAALFHTLFEDEVLKNGFASAAAAQFEISAYRALIVMAVAAGDVDAARDLQQSLSELRGFAAWLDDHLPGTVIMHLQLRSAGEQARR